MIKRIIGKLEIKNDFVVKGLQMEGVQRVGDPIKLAKEYYDAGIDELLLIDTVASLYRRVEIDKIISQIIKNTFIPVCAGGGIKSIDDVTKLINSGADKICINTSAIENPSLIKDISGIFGSQSTVMQIDVKHYNNSYIPFYNTGRDPSQFNLQEWISILQDKGAGEIILTSVDKDGMEGGPDKKLIDELDSFNIGVPLIFGGGLKSYNDIKFCLESNNIDGVSISSAIHFNKILISDIKSKLASDGIIVRKFIN